ISAPPVEGVLRRVTETRKPFFEVLWSFCETTSKYNYISDLTPYIICEILPNPHLRSPIMLTPPVIHRL
ncbi:hypothetical protein, partial [uncultured Sulfitobacter sp.]|uniref:hypothetical protein n=1 Tax=uncultured Sulfitobacter sp. TaxID=191468 RepID=UPI0030DA0056